MGVPTALPFGLSRRIEPRSYGTWGVVWEPFPEPVWFEFHTPSLYFGDLIARKACTAGNEFIRQPVYIPKTKLKECEVASDLRKAALLEEMFDIANGRLERSMDRANTGAFKPEIETKLPRLTPADYAKARFRA